MLSSNQAASISRQQAGSSGKLFWRFLILILFVCQIAPHQRYYASVCVSQNANLSIFAAQPSSLLDHHVHEPLLTVRTGSYAADRPLPFHALSGLGRECCDDMLSGFEQLPLTMSCEQFYISFYVFAFHFHIRHRPPLAPVLSLNVPHVRDMAVLSSRYHLCLCLCVVRAVGPMGMGEGSAFPPLCSCSCSCSDDGGFVLVLRL